MLRINKIVSRLFTTNKRPILPYEIIEQEEKEILSEFYRHPLLENRKKGIYEVEQEEWMEKNDRED